MSKHKEDENKGSQRERLSSNISFSSIIKRIASSLNKIKQEAPQVALIKTREENGRELLGYVKKVSALNLDFTTLKSAWAAYEKPTKFLENLKRGEIDVNVKDDKGITIFWYACKIDDLKLKKLLLVRHDAAESINVAGEDGKTPIWLACYAQNIRLAELLLQHGAAKSINVEDASGTTPLGLACNVYGHHELSKTNRKLTLLVLMAGAEVKPKDVAKVKEVLQLDNEVFNEQFKPVQNPNGTTRCWLHKDAMYLQQVYQNEMDKGASTAGMILSRAFGESNALAHAFAESGYPQLDPGSIAALLAVCKTGENEDLNNRFSIKTAKASIKSTIEQKLETDLKAFADRALQREHGRA